MSSLAENLAKSKRASASGSSSRRLGDMENKNNDSGKKNRRSSLTGNDSTDDEGITKKNRKSKKKSSSQEVDDGNWEKVRNARQAGALGNSRRSRRRDSSLSKGRYDENGNARSYSLYDDIILKEVNDAPSTVNESMHRNPISGKAYLKDVNTKLNFLLVDLISRKDRDQTWTLNDLRHDGYIFVPKILTFRSWLYQEVQRAAKVGHFNDEKSADSLLMNSTHRLAFALLCKVNDKLQTGSYGMWNPAQVYAFMLFLTVLSSVSLAFVSLFTFCLCLYSHSVCNSWRYYRLGRMITLPFRYVCAYLTLNELFDLSGLMAQGKFQAIVALFFTICLHLYDIAADIVLFYSIEEESHLELVRMLPGKVFHCKYKQAGSMSLLGSGLNKSEYLNALVGNPPSGSIPGTDGTVLIAEIHGILVELLPISRDWEQIIKNTLAPGFDHGLEIKTYCTHSFTENRKNAKDFDEYGQPASNDPGEIARQQGVLKQIKKMRAHQVAQWKSIKETAGTKQRSGLAKKIQKLLVGFQFGASYKREDVNAVWNKVQGFELLDIDSVRRAIDFTEEQRLREGLISQVKARQMKSVRDKELNLGFV